jgi:uncharacterized LabA/DUF88 family protein
MIIKHKEQRVAIFIDTSNLYHSAKHLYKRKVNFGAVLKEAVGGRKLVRAIAYVITSEGGEEKSFFEALTKNFKYFPEVPKKAIGMSGSLSTR